MLIVYVYSRLRDLPGSYFATITLLLTVILASTGWIVPGVDALVALCLTMGILSLANYYIDQQLNNAIKEGLVEVPPAAPVSRFCTTQMHDFAVASQEYGGCVESINKEDWVTLLETMSAFSPVDRQGFYANINYSSINPDAALNFVKNHPDNRDALVLCGHVNLCVAKGAGLVPGVIPGENAADAVAQAFKHFRQALRLDGDDVEALCGLILAKGYIALNDEHIESTLVKLLTLDRRHFHGLMSAALFLIRSSDGANRFVSIVENCVGDDEVTLAVTRTLAHVECADFSGGAFDSRVVADLYAQLEIYKRARQSLGNWQKNITGNVVAYAFEMIGDNDEKARQLSELDGYVSPYPWQRKCVRGEFVPGVLAG